MEHLLIPYWALAVLFAAVAFLYSSVGLAGGSSYIALMAISGVDYTAVPTIALAMNIMVSSLGLWNFVKADHARWQIMAPFLASSVPFAWLGGTVRLPSRTFHMMLFVFLAMVALRIYLFSSFSAIIRPGRTARIAISLVAGAGLGFISGALGLGGGIYLVPLVVILGLGSQKEAAACGAAFIWVNSAAGLLARLGSHPPPPAAVLVPLLAATAAGGFAGSFLGANRFSARTMQRLLGTIILAAMAFMVPRFI